MRTTLEIDDNLLDLARKRAAEERRSIGSVISEMAYRGLEPAEIDLSGPWPVFVPPSGARPITPEMVREALDEEN